MAPPGPAAVLAQVCPVVAAGASVVTQGRSDDLAAAAPNVLRCRATLHVRTGAHVPAGVTDAVPRAAAPQGTVQAVLVVLLLDRVPVYVQHDAG